MRLTDAHEAMRTLLHSISERKWRDPKQFVRTGMWNVDPLDDDATRPLTEEEICANIQQDIESFQHCLDARAIHADSHSAYVLLGIDMIEDRLR